MLWLHVVSPNVKEFSPQVGGGLVEGLGILGRRRWGKQIIWNDSEHDALLWR